MPVSPSFTELRPGLVARHQRTSPGIVASTLCYLLLGDDHEVAVIDPGEDSEENWQLLTGTLAVLGRASADIATVIVTHLHADHLGMAERVRAASGAELLLHRNEQGAIESRYGGASTERLALWGVPPQRRAELEQVIRTRAGRPRTRADRLLDDGDIVRVCGRELTVLWTPGHTTGSICLDLRDDGAVFTGDHLLPMMYPGIGLGGHSDANPLREYLASLRRVEALGEREGLPGHGYPFEDAAARCRETFAHHARRTEEVARGLDAMPRPTVWELASTLRWSAGWNGLHGYALDSALAQTRMHVDYLGRLDELGDVATVDAPGIAGSD